ncbi:uncharacterized protein FIBRA_05438 [Fibroporia radiculosa]|uniref:Uncharacterized protein n=1 Tax=Fibroporia radiculosa TaxID=599839 RepID=J4GR04_9APHY|nr:uncharacterized protein FIBRA_05438 [Fibroporia radiculosa]CCM03310.1 predicted protein [Fibroporia radiculosa]
MLSPEESVISPVAWRRQPSTRDALFGLTLSYRPPKNPTAALIWRKRMVIESTIGTYALEPWEKFLVFSFVFIVFILTIIGLFKYAIFVKHRTAYYLYSPEPQETVERAVDWVVRNFSREF